MADVINQTENIETGKSELWITIKDASDLLGISERHTWNVILENGFQRKKLLNQNRKKSYVLRADIEKICKEDLKRQRLEALKPPPPSEISEKSEKSSELEMSESEKSALSEIQMTTSGGDSKVKNLPALFSEMQKKQEILLKSATTWRVTTIWISILGIAVTGFLYLYLTDTKKVLSEKEKVFSENQKALFEMSEREKQAIKGISEREIYIKDLEQNIPQRELDQLKVKRGKDGY